MTVIEKIYFRENALYFLEYHQYCQLQDRNLLVLAPYYRERLARQAEQVYRAEQFKNIYGKSRYEYENNL